MKSHLSRDNLFNCKYEDNSLSTGYGTKYCYVRQSQMDKRKYEEEKKNRNYIFVQLVVDMWWDNIKYIFSSNNPGFIWLDSFSHSNCEYDMFYGFYGRIIKVRNWRWHWLAHIFFLFVFYSWWTATNHKIRCVIWC